MDRVYGARVVQVEPSFAADAPSGYPTDGSSSGGQLATVPTAPWYNAVTEEIRNAIVGGGIDPERNTLNQLDQSIEARLAALEEKLTGMINAVSGKVDKFETFPPGFIIYTGNFINSPVWLLCDGRAVSRSAYSALFAAIGTTWGAGNGSTTFNVPYLLDRVLWGSNVRPGEYIDSGAPGISGVIGDFNAYDNDTRCQVPSGERIHAITKAQNQVLTTSTSRWNLTRTAAPLFMDEQGISSRRRAERLFTSIFNKLRKGLF